MLYRLLLATVLVSCGQEETVTEFQPRVVWTVAPESQATIVWSEGPKQSNSYIEMSLEPDLSGSLIHPTTAPSRNRYHNSRLFETNENPVARAAKFISLKPSTVYYFRVRNSQQSSAIYEFKTAPIEGNYQLLFGGDSRSDIPQRREMNRIIHDYIVENPDVIALVHGGDYIADGSDWRQWSAWLNDYQITTVNNRLLPIIPTRGNHETDEILYRQVFGIDHHTYFATELPHLNLVTLDSEISILGDQFQWLKETLKSGYEEKVAWQVTNYHRPAYPAVKKPDATIKWAPLFETYGVRLAFESDGHVFKQTVPIFNNQKDVERGVIYLGEGGLGVKQRTPKFHRWYLNQGGLAASKHHFMAAHIDPDELEVKVIDDTHATFHQLRLQH